MTIVGDGLSISVFGNGHRITVTGSNNLIKIRGINNNFRIQGIQNTIIGFGRGVQVGVFSLNPVVYRNISVEVLRDDAAPVVLTTGLGPQRDRYTLWTWKTVRFAYRQRVTPPSYVDVRAGVKRPLEDDNYGQGDATSNKRRAISKN